MLFGVKEISHSGGGGRKRKKNWGDAALGVCLYKVACPAVGNNEEVYCIYIYTLSIYIPIIPYWHVQLYIYTRERDWCIYPRLCRCR